LLFFQKFTAGEVSFSAEILGFRCSSGQNNSEKFAVSRYFALFFFTTGFNAMPDRLR
jgi:hypothetical protein